LSKIDDNPKIEDFTDFLKFCFLHLNKTMLFFFSKIK